jgi:hypothetical protein
LAVRNRIYTGKTYLRGFLITAKADFACVAATSSHQGVPFYEHISNLEASFRGALPLSGPLPALLSEALEEIYYDPEWTGSEEGTPENLQIPTMRDLYEKITALFATKD